MDACDEYIPDPKDDTDDPFFMPVEQFFTVPGRGSVATGTIIQGSIKKNDTMELIGCGKRLEVNSTGLRVLKTPVNEAKSGENVGLLLKGVESEFVCRGIYVCQPNSQIMSNLFRAKIYVHTNADNGL